MKKSDKPSQHFIGAILRGYDNAERERSGPVTCSKIWDYVVMECFRAPGHFTAMFDWDTSTAEKKNRIRDIGECIERGYVPDLRVDDKLVVTRT